MSIGLPAREEKKMKLSARNILQGKVISVTMDITDSVSSSAPHSHRLE